MKTIEHAKEYVDGLVQELADEHPEAIRFHDLDQAVIGIARQHAGCKPVLCYSERSIIEVLATQFGKDAPADDAMTPEEHAWDWYGFNISCLAVGDGTPIIVTGEPE